MMFHQTELRRWDVVAGWRDRPQQGGRRRLNNFCQPGEHRRPWSIGSTHPGRVSMQRNVVTPMGSGRGVACPVGRPQGRLNSAAGVGWPKKLMPAAERQQETEECGWLFRRLRRITGRIPGAGGCLGLKER